ncbi:hypothetical protein ABT324_25870 [Saccharopolyspora sp. NPDC000359]|uniref:hypothetical protein n=1 Tax=Saccharopolyspora sp. NPDC000359 TaxID=3154251 RepID=UPI00333421E6
MSGIRVDVEWLATYAREVRTAGDEIATAPQELAAAELAPESFGELGRSAGAAESYQRLVELLVDQSRRASEALTRAGDELREVVDFHTSGDDDGAVEIRKQGS